MLLDKKLQDYVQAQFPPPVNHVYHYTNETGYCEITRCGYLKLNSHLFLNDKDKNNRELETAVNLIRGFLKETTNYFTQQKFEKYISKGIIYYSASFTRQRSNNKYGDFCLEFCQSFLARTASTARTNLFSSVVYDSTKQLEIIKQMFKIYNHHKKLEPTDNTNDRIDFFTWLSVIIPLLKSNEDKNDTECRIIQAEIFAPDNGELSTPRVTKKIPFTDQELIQIYRE